jgi:hypothetical protein
MRGNRIFNDEYLAICENTNPVKILIKLAFKTEGEKELWGKHLIELMNPEAPKA